MSCCENIAKSRKKSRGSSYFLTVTCGKALQFIEKLTEKKSGEKKDTFGKES
jgi:hypothetical protein